MQFDDIASNWHYPSEIFFGRDEISRLGEHLQTLNSVNPLFVVDKGLLELPAIVDCLSAVNASQQAIFSDFRGNPTGSNVTAGMQLCQQGSHDSVVAIGGGSAIDMAKTIALLAFQHCSLWDLVDDGDNFRRADTTLILPIIAVPTTAGTGSEVGRTAVIVDESDQQKKIIFHPQMMPSIVVADPVLSLTLPAHLTAATGMDALAHNLEALCAPGYHPMADGIAMEGLRLISDWLPIAVEDGSNLNARTHMMAAALMGATAFQKGLGAVHSLSHPVGGMYNAHHGLLNAIFLPYVLQFNRTYIDEKMQRLARYLALPQSSFDAVLDWVLNLLATLNLPNNLQAINIDDSSADTIAQRAFMDPSTLSNPRALSPEALKLIYRAAVNGDLTTLATVTEER